VKAVTPDRVPGVELVGEAVDVGLRRHRLVERGIEHRDVRDARQEAAGGRQSAEVVRVVERRQHHALLDHRLDLGRHQHRGRELLAAVHDAVADGLDLADALEHPVLGVHEDAEDALDGGAVLQDLRDLLVGLAALDVDGEARVREADLLDQAAGQRLVAVGLDHLERRVDDLELHGRRPAVEHKDLHRALPSSSRDRDAQFSFGVSSGRRSSRWRWLS
jgi:hypothetical protein